MLRNKFNHGGERSVQGELQDFAERNWRHSKWKDIPCSWVGKINIVNQPDYPKLSIESVPSPSKAFFPEINNLKFLWSHKRPLIAKAVLRGKKTCRDITLPDFKLYYRVTVIKTVWHRHTNRHMDQWDRMESPKLNPDVYVQLTSDKGAESARQNKESSSNKLLGKLEKHMQNSERGPCLTQKN